MNAAKVIAKLRQQYPGKTILSSPEDHPTEILCEVDPPSKHPEYSIAVSVIDQSAQHVHHKITETYTVISGTLKLTKNNTISILHRGESIIIVPGEIHSASGEETWVECIARPAWTPGDHILVS